jgi:hypothetical protein
MVTDSLRRLHDEVESALTDPYLLTVTGDCRPHCSCSAVVWNEGRLLVPAPSGWGPPHTQGHQQVTLLWPPAQPGGYSLIVDGVATTLPADGEARLAVTPTRAVLHRRGSPPSPSGSSCKSDCILIPG